jgi:hypothetical protein
MRFVLRKAAIAVGLIASINARATTDELWSACETIKAVVNETSYSTAPQVYLILSPPINIANGAPANCMNNGVAGALGFVVGMGGINSSNINSYLASSLSAFNAGHQVTIYYDYTNASECFGIDIADGGWTGACAT